MNFVYKNGCKGHQRSNLQWHYIKNNLLDFIRSTIYVESFIIVSRSAQNAQFFVCRCTISTSLYKTHIQINYIQHIYIQTQIYYKRQLRLTIISKRMQFTSKKSLIYNRQDIKGYTVPQKHNIYKKRITKRIYIVDIIG